MNDQNLKHLISSALTSLDGGLTIAQRSIDEVRNAATHSGLKSALREGEQHTQQWQSRVKAALKEANVSPDSEPSNRVIEAYGEVAKKMRDTAEGDDVRDLGIIASGQLALHYWISAFGTFGAYAKQVGMNETAQAMHKCVEEATQADEKHTQLASQIMSA